MRIGLSFLSLSILASAAAGQFAPGTSVGRLLSKKPSSPRAADTGAVGGRWVPADRVYVDRDAGGANDGTSWANAFTDLQAALSATSGGEIWVSEGTYHPGPAGDQYATFQLATGVELLGGFAGGETNRSQRDAAVNATVLSGDIDENDTYGSGLNWWQFAWTGSAGNSFHVVTGSGTDPTAVLDGFTILAGLAADPALRGGGGLVVDGGSPSIRNCTFRYNALGYGSSAWLNDCNSVFEDCVIRDAYACNCGAGGWTSGIVCQGTSDVMFLRCDFVNHYYVSSQYQGRGAALNLDFNCSGTLIDCRFEGNQTGNFYPIGGGTAYGGGIFSSGDLVVDRCEFIDNFAHAGAGITAWGNLTVTNSSFARNRAVSHPNGSGFNDGGYGGGLLTLGSGTNTVNVTNCTFVENNTDKGAGLALYGAGTAIVRNSIAYYNFANPPEPGEDTIWILKQQIVGSYDIANSCVEGLLQTEPGEDPPEPANFPGCIDAAPGLVDLDGDDYLLQPGSPCIDAGDNMGGILETALDLNGNPRFYDDPSTPDTGLGTAPIVDMGCYEFTGAIASTLHAEGDAPRMTVDIGRVSLSRGGVATLSLRAGSEHAGMPYRVLGSTVLLSCDAPAPLGAFDPYRARTVARSGGGPLLDGAGILDAHGRATAALVVPPGSPAELAAFGFRQTFVVFTPSGDMVTSNDYVLVELVR